MDLVRLSSVRLNYVKCFLYDVFSSIASKKFKDIKKQKIYLKVTIPRIKKNIKEYFFYIFIELGKKNKIQLLSTLSHWSKKEFL